MSKLYFHGGRKEKKQAGAELCQAQVSLSKLMVS